MKTIEIGRNVQQPGGYKAFIPAPFPPQKGMDMPRDLAMSHAEATRLLGKLDGISILLPDIKCFHMMFLRKDASNSSQIEGTNATMMDVIEHQNVEPRTTLPADVDDIVHYIEALNYGLERSKTLPFSLRFICELHKKLMFGARATQIAYPGQFRTAQNWIGGTRPDNARFVPPPPEEMKIALGDLETFVHADNGYLPLVKAGLLHAQFEAIHPFNDGNGRTGRMLITLFLWNEKLLEVPLLYLSAFFKKHQQLYYERLDAYCRGYVFDWLSFFFEGIMETAQSAITTCAQITEIHERDMRKIQSLGKTSAVSTLNVLTQLYTMPIVGIADIVKWTSFTKTGGYNMINRLVDMDILKPMQTEGTSYNQKWMYNDYLQLFESVD